MKMYSTIDGFENAREFIKKLGEFREKTLQLETMTRKFQLKGVK